jgi:cytochrome c nitrite reductase small subunit
MNRSLASILLGTILGAALGVGLYTFVYAKGGSYLTNDPAACANCHVMRDYYDGWLKSPHRSVAACNDCHTPHAPLPKYATKAANGWHHSFAFTSGEFPDNLRIKSHNESVTEAACRRCHEPVVFAIDGPTAHGSPGVSCVHCHRSVGHLR